ncbi:choline BCCT transporter BetT [Helcobacillus sp. ACRRO]|uniref:choline BCCT transporter BetT n=1 Tax=Helcobacillus sp. ACRRO TaxID=2918202 RepID=UPI001EF6B0F9|nr:choline BCCT transporter BetT [Helcobacillus sp. ACRRO]MCG7426721.1 choline BCCT transporter BetT [Helcobacillus sp. ACRRO]
MARTYTSDLPVVNEPRPKWLVFGVAAVFTVVVSGWALLAPANAEGVLGAAVEVIGDWVGWAYIALATVVLAFVIYLAIRFGRVRLGQDTDRPEFSTFAWASMLFAAGIGTDVMFFAVAEPATQFLSPPSGEPGTVQAAREAVVWPLFHYGVTGWGMYALMGIALGYFAHRRGLPLAVRSALYPLVGRRIHGAVGHAADIATVLGTIFGVATSLGIGVVMLNVGLGILFGFEQGVPVQVGLVVLAVAMATISATTGVDKGIRILSQLNVALALVLAGWVLVTGHTTYLLRAAVMNVGDFVSMFPGLTLNTMAYDYDALWMNSWTLFFWAWWVAWASFVGMFLARISRGRTIRQFVIGTLLIPFSYILMWVTVFGNATIKRITDGDTAFGQVAADSPESGFFELLSQVPLAPAVIAVATFVGLLFYVTSADSGALVMANLCSELPHAEADAKPWLRIFWAAATGVITIAMLIVGGITALQYATVVMGVPFAIVMVLVMLGLHRALSEEERTSLAYQRSVRGAVVGRIAAQDRNSTGGSWKRRLARQFGSVTQRQAEAELSARVIPAMEEVRSELQGHGVDVAINHEEIRLESVVKAVTLLVPAAEEGYEHFEYRVQIREMRAPTYGRGMIEADDTTYEVETLVPGGGVYNIMGWSEEEIAHDILNHFTWWSGTFIKPEADVQA